MSTGNAIPLAVAGGLLRSLKQRLDAACLTDLERSALACMGIAGSVRRRKPEVRDFEFVAPWRSPPTGKVERSDDALFRVLSRIAHVEVAEKAPASLFAPPAPKEPEFEKVLRPLRGLKPGFLAAHCELDIDGMTVPVQFFRSAPDRFGWLVLMRTGPEEFGKHFLIQWKKRYGIAWENNASIDGALHDAGGRVIETRDEADCFRLCAMEYVAPAHREAFVARVLRQASNERSWQTR